MFSNITSYVSKRPLTWGVRSTFDKRYRFAQVVPQLCIVLVFLGGVYFDIEFGKEYLSKIEQSNIYVSAAELL